MLHGTQALAAVSGQWVSRFSFLSSSPLSSPTASYLRDESSPPLQLFHWIAALKKTDWGKVSTKWIQGRAVCSEVCITLDIFKVHSHIAPNLEKGKYTCLCAWVEGRDVSFPSFHVRKERDETLKLHSLIFHFSLHRENAPGTSLFNSSPFWTYFPSPSSSYP